MSLKSLWPKYKKWIIVGGIVVVILLILIFRNGKSADNYDYITVNYNDLKQEVSVTGTVKPVDQVDLAFERSGRVQEVFYDIGDFVETNEVIVALDNSDLQSQLARAKAQVAEARAQLLSAQANAASVQAQSDQAQSGVDVQEIKLDELKRGATVEQLNVSRTKVNNAQTTLKDAQDKYEEVKLLATTQLSNAEQAVEDAKDNSTNVINKADVDLKSLERQIEDVLYDGFVKGDSALNKDISGIFIFDSLNQYAYLTFQVSDAFLESQVLSSRRDAIQGLKEYKTRTDDVLLTHSNYIPALEAGVIDLRKVRDFLNYTDDLLDKSIGLDPTIKNGYEASVNTARVNVNLAISSLNNQAQLIDGQEALNDQTIKTAQTAVNKAENDLALTEVSTKNAIAQAERQVTESQNLLKLYQDELALIESGATSEELLTQQSNIKSAESQQKSAQALVHQAWALASSRQAAVEQALAQVQEYETQIEKTKLKAPFAGIITKQEATVGELMIPDKLVVVLISENKYEIEAQVPEVDIAKLRVDVNAKVTLDAYGEDIYFDTFISQIEPAEVIVDGVPTYKVVLQFREADERIKSGMTANIEIITAQRDNVIAVPQRAVITENGERFVRILNKDNSVSEVIVKTGLRSSDGSVEITEGINKDDRVIVFFEE